uniref:Uncharacterized protein n=1 Tax=Rhizophora mucronata TaxID=61149 RepID=A0A2P2QZP7_RHIMU
MMTYIHPYSLCLSFSGFNLFLFLNSYQLFPYEIRAV